MNFSDEPLDPMNEFAKSISEQIYKQRDLGIQMGLKFACQRLRPDLNPEEFVQQIIEEAKNAANRSE